MLHYLLGNHNKKKKKSLHTLRTDAIFFFEYFRPVVGEPVDSELGGGGGGCNSNNYLMELP